jgi:hypothetical protein
MSQRIIPMPGGAGFIWATIICIPFWLIVILFIKGVIAVKTLIFVGLALSALLVPLILIFPQKAKQDKQDKDIIIEDSHAPTIQSKTPPHDSFGSGTSG